MSARGQALRGHDRKNFPTARLSLMASIFYFSAEGGLYLSTFFWKVLK